MRKVVIADSLQDWETGKVAEAVVEEYNQKAIGK